MYFHCPSVRKQTPKPKLSNQWLHSVSATGAGAAVLQAKEVRDPTQPKRALGAYMLFAIDKRGVCLMCLSARNASASFRD